MKWIRKLTPLEALRLQGFPDSFFNRVYNAKVSDTQIYMQAGNSVTVKVIESIFDHLIKEDWFK